MSEKQKYVKRICLEDRIHHIMGEYSELLPRKKLILSYSDTTWKEVVIDESNVNITENPLSGKIDITIKLSVGKEER